MNNEIPVPNKTVKYFTYDYFDVDTVGLLADCAPSVRVARTRRLIGSTEMLASSGRKVGLDKMGRLLIA